MSIKTTLDLVRENNGFEGKGFKMIATETGLERTLVRFTLEAYRNPIYSQAVDCGVIRDPKVIAVLKKFPKTAASAVCKIESRLGRHLARSRIEKLHQFYEKVVARRVYGDDALVFVDRIRLAAMRASSTCDELVSA